MANYIQPPNPQYFDIPGFDAPTEFLFQVSRQKQMEFDRGLDMVSSQFKSMENLPVNSPYALSKRDSYMSDIKKKLKNISGADFSLAENRYAANSVYKPLTSDKDILEDLATGRHLYKQVGIADKLQNSKNDNERSAYWDTGRAYVNESIRQLQNAKTADELHAVEKRNYVPYVDIAKKLNDAADKLHIKIAIDDIKGGYKLTKENGEAANLPFYVWAQSQLGGPEREVFKVMGAVEGDNRIQQEMYSKGISEKEARMNLAGEALDRRFDDYTNQISSNLKAIENLNTEKKTLENAGVTDLNIDKWMDVKQKIDFMENQNKSVETRLRDIGYNKIAGQYVKDQRYNNTLKVFAKDLSLPYAEDASRNIITNWAAGLAGATAGLKIGEDPQFNKLIDLKMKEIEATKDIAIAEGKGSSTSKTKETAGKEDFIDQPLQVGENPYAQEQMTTYEYYESQKKEITNHLFDRGVTLINDALPEIGLSPDFLTDLTKNIKTNPQGSVEDLRKKYPQDYQKLRDASKNCLIGDDMSNTKVFGDLTKLANERTLEKVKSAEDPLQKSYLFANSEEVRMGLGVFKAFKHDESVVSSEILSKDKYKSFVKDNDFISKEDFVKNSTGFSSVDDFRKKGSEVPINMSKEAIEMGKKLDFNEFQTAPNEIYESIIDVAGKEYDKKYSQFQKEFKDLINTGKLNFLNVEKTPSGQLAWTYPTVELMSRENPSSGERELSERVLANAFSPDNIKVVNANELGGAKEITNLAKSFQNELTDFKPDMGKLYYNPISRDGVNPGILFKPSGSFLKRFTSKGSPLDNSTLEKISRYGIELSIDNKFIPELKNYRPSLVGKLIDIDTEYMIAPGLKSEGFSGKIRKRPNNEGYDVYMSYKIFDKDGNEKIIEDEFQNPGQPIPNTRLDFLANSITNDVLNFYSTYKKTIKSKSDNTPKKTYSVEELEQLYKNRQ